MAVHTHCTFYKDSIRYKILKVEISVLKLWSHTELLDSLVAKSINNAFILHYFFFTNLDIKILLKIFVKNLLNLNTMEQLAILSFLKIIKILDVLS